MRKFKNLKGKEKLEYIAILLMYPMFLLFRRLGKGMKLFSTRKRQLVASALSVAIILTAFPALSFSAFAGTTGSTSVMLFNKYQMVNGNQITYLVGMDDRTNVADRVQTTPASDGNYLAMYEPSSNTLTIRDLGDLSNDNYGGLYANGDLNLRLVGSNRFRKCSKYGVKADGNLKIFGDGALFISCGRGNGRSSAICAGGDIEIRGNYGYSQPTIVAVGNNDYTVKAGGSIKVRYVDLTLYSAWNIYGVFNKVPNEILGGKITVSTDNMGKDPTDNIDDSKLTMDYKYLRMIPDGYRDAYDTASLKEAAADKSCKVINLLALDDYDHDSEYIIGISDEISFNHSVKLVSLGGSWIRRDDNYKGAFFKIGDDGSKPDVTFTGLFLWGYGVKNNDTVVGNDSTIIVESGSLTFKGANSLQYFNAGSANGAAVNVKSGATLNLNGSYISFFRNETTGLGGAIYNEGTLNMKSGQIVSNKAADGGGIYSCNSGQISLVGNTGYVDVAYNTTTDGTRNNLRLANWKRIKTDGKVYTTRKIYITPCATPTLTQSVPVISANYFMGSFASDIHGAEPDYKEYEREIHLAVTHPHCVCGKEHEEIGDHKDEDIRWFEGWDQTDSLPKEPGNYYLKNDIVLKDPDHHAYLYNGVNICMNGHDIYATYGAREVLATMGNWIEKDGDTNYKLYPWDQEGVVTNCRTGGGRIKHKDVTVEDKGRGVQVDGEAKVSFYHIKVTDNKTMDNYDGGGGIYVSNAAVSLYDCRITNNYAYHYGGGISGAQKATINIFNSEISENTANSFGGGIELGNSSKLRIENTEIKSNTSTYCGGGISVVAYNPDVSLKDTTMLGNHAQYYGGGIYSLSPVKLSGNSYVLGNHAGHKDANKSIVDNIYINNNTSVIQLTGSLTGQYKSGITSSQVPRVVVTGNNYTITEADLNQFRSDVDNYELVLKDNEITMKTKLKNLTASDISVTMPSDLTYNGNAKTVKVAPKTGVNCGSLWVEYYNDKGELLDGYPRDAGDYTFKVKANANSVYNEAELSSSDWKFTIKKWSLAAYDLTFGKIDKCIFNVNGATPDLSLTVKATGEQLVKGKDYTLSYENNKKEGYATVKYQLIGNYAGNGKTSFYISYGSVKDTMYSASLESKNDYYNDDVTLYATEGYEIGADDHTFSDSVTFTEEISTYYGHFYVKAANGDVYRGSYGIDKTKPDVTISFKQNMFKTFLNKISFGLFYKNEQVDVTISATDAFSGTDSYYYQLVKTQDEYDENGTWTRGNKLYLRDKMTFIVYAKVVDKVGNVTIINSDGAVIYADSSFTKRNAIFDKNVENAADVELAISFKGNTVKSVKNGEELLTLGTDYTVSDTGITFKKEYLNKFEPGHNIQTFTVAFNPQGIETDKVSIEDTCSIKIMDTTHRHSPVHHGGVAASCLADGTLEYWTCAGCDKLFSDGDCKNEITSTVIPKIAHKNAQKTDAKSETCTEKGNRAYYHCPDCGKYFAEKDGALDPNDSYNKADSFELQAHGHNYTEKIQDTAHLKSAATCLERAVYYYDCTYCDKISETDTYEFGDELGHDFTKKITDEAHLKSAATCTAPAEYYYGCTRCDAKSKLDTYTDGDKLGHDFTEKIQDDAHLKTPATCTGASVYYYDCSRCDEVSTEDTFEGSALGHSFTKKVPDDAHLKTPATCTEPAEYFFECETCGEKSTDLTFKNGEALGHDFGEETVTKEPTAVSAGEKSCECKVCQFVKTTKIDPLTLEFVNKDTETIQKSDAEDLSIELNNVVTETGIKVFINGKQLKSGDFSLSDEGKTLVLSENYLSALKAGKYTLKVSALSGDITKSIVVEASGENGSGKTPSNSGKDNKNTGSKNTGSSSKSSGTANNGSQNSGSKGSTQNGSENGTQNSGTSPKTAEDRNTAAALILLFLVSGTATLAFASKKRAR